jgi:hypothetical protein
MTAHERTGWRDQEISNRHRVWGFNCPSVDLDFVMVEYNFGAPVAVVDYKHHLSSIPVGPSHPTMKALGSLYGANGEQLPFFVAYYWPETWAFRVKPFNDSAREILSTECCDMCEREWVQLLYALRQQHLSHFVYSKLCAQLPPSSEAA